MSVVICKERNMKTRLYNIFKTTNPMTLIKAILQTPLKFSKYHKNVMLAIHFSWAFLTPPVFIFF